MVRLARLSRLPSGPGTTCQFLRSRPVRAMGVFSRWGTRVAHARLGGGAFEVPSRGPAHWRLPLPLRDVPTVALLESTGVHTPKITG